MMWNSLARLRCKMTTTGASLAASRWRRERCLIGAMTFSTSASGQKQTHCYRSTDAATDPKQTCNSRVVHCSGAFAQRRSALPNHQIEGGAGERFGAVGSDLAGSAERHCNATFVVSDDYRNEEHHAWLHFQRG